LTVPTGATTTIVAKHSGKCLDVRGGVIATGDAAAIEQWSCSGQANQAWTLQRIAYDSFEMIASNSGKCVDVFNDGTANGTAIQQMSCTGRPNQLWRLKSLGSGLYQIISTSSGRCLDVTGGPAATGNGVLTELWDCSGQANQSWALNLPTYAVNQMMSLWSGKCLDVTGGSTATADGVPIEQWTCSGQPNQAWTVKDMGGYQYEIIAGNSGKCLDIVNSNPATGTSIQQMTCTGKPNQLWILHSIDLGQFQAHSILNKENCLRVRGAGNTNSGLDDGALVEAGDCDYDGSPDTGWTMQVAVPIKLALQGDKNECLDVRGGERATADGTPVEIWTCTGLKNQSWIARDIGDGEHQIVASNSGKCLDLVGGIGEGSKGKIAQCANTLSQLWSTSSAGQGRQLLNVNTLAGEQYSLDIVGGNGAESDGVLTQTIKRSGLEHAWLIGTPAFGR
jgi:hypothetical protein